MSDPIEIYANSPKELVVIQVTVQGTIVTTGYKVCIYENGGTRPTATDPAWQTPDTAGTDTGIFIGSASTVGAFAKDKYLQPWYYLIDTPEQIIRATTPLVRTI